MGRKRVGYIGTLGSGARRARVVAETGEDDYIEKNPIALATAAKERKRDEYLRAAAMAAARAAPPDITTWLAPGLRPANSEPNAGDANGLGEYYDPETVTAPKTAAEHLDDGRNALTDLLGYSAGERRDNAPSQNADIKESIVPSPARGALESARDLSTTPVGDDMDDEYSNFMGELEASGLLKDMEEEPQTAAKQPTPAPDDSNREAVDTEAIQGAVADASQQEGGHEAVYPQQSEALEERQDGLAAEQQNGGTAEQRVLGTLEGTTDWVEVLDMGSGKVYFWNQVTNEVLWDPPVGSAPKSKAATDAIYEAGQSETAARHDADAPPAEGPAGRDGAAFVKEEEGPQDVGQLGAEVSAKLASAQERLGVEISALQRLAIEAQIRQQDWDTLLQVGALPWAPFERYQRLCWERIEAEAAGAIQAAEAAAWEHAQSNAEAVKGAEMQPNLASEVEKAREDGEVSLGSEENMDVDRAEPTSVQWEASQEAVPPPLPSDSADHTPPTPADPEVIHQPLVSGSSDGASSGSVTPPLPMEGAANGASGGTSSANAAAEYLNAAIANGVLRGSAPAVKRKEYSAQPVHAELDLSELEHEPQQSAGVPDYLPPPLPEDPLPEAAKRKRDAKLPASGSKKKKLSAKVSKTASKLIDKWAAVRKDLVAEEEEEEEPDAEAAERRRLREAEEWRLKQLHAGTTAEVNANFQPVAGDWRQKVKAANKKQAKEAKAAASVAASEPAQPAHTLASGAPDLRALAIGLKPGWKPMWDPTSRDVYYGNLSTKETSWDRPT